MFFKKTDKPFKQLRSVKLSLSDRSSIRDHLAEHIRSNPLTRAGVIPAHTTWLGNEQSLIALLKKPFMALAMITLLLVVGGGVYAAEQSLPGDPLYPIKIHVVEEVRATLAATPKAKARLETEFASRRLEELEKLSTNNELKPEIKQQLEIQFEIHTEKATQVSNSLQFQGNTPDALEIQSNVEAVLSAHTNIIARVHGELREAGNRIDQTAQRIRERNDEVSQGRKELEIKIKTNVKASSETAAVNKRKEARAFLDKTKLFIEQKTEADTELRKESIKKLDEAEQVFIEGDTNVNAKAYAESLAKFQEAQRRAQEARLVIATFHKLELKMDKKKRGDKDNSEENEATSTIIINTNGNEKRFDGLKNLNLNIPFPNGSFIFKNEFQNKNNEKDEDRDQGTSNSSLNLNSSTTINSEGGTVFSQTNTSITSDSNIRINSSETWINGVKVEEE